jgi:hypothetical protein
MNICGLPAVKWCRITVTTIKAGAAGFPHGRLWCWGLACLFYWQPEPYGG